jgi:hypothetical protein
VWTVFIIVALVVWSVGNLIAALLLCGDGLYIEHCGCRVQVVKGALPAGPKSPVIVVAEQSEVWLLVSLWCFFPPRLSNKSVAK